MIDLKEIKPKVKGKSDKYSWNLYRFLEKQVKQRDIGKYVLNQIKVYWIARDWWDGSYLEFDPLKIAYNNQVVISPFGGKLSGYFLSHILRDGKNECYSLCVYRDDQLIDITDWFFKEYKKDGRCIFDRNHDRWLASTEGRYTYVNNTRKCNWCGQWHKKEIHKVVKIKREEVWI
jgi:hypothetical protein